MRKRLLPPVYLFAGIILMLGLNFLLPVVRVLLFPWTLIGVVVMAVGIALTLTGARTIKRHGTTIKPFEVSSSLVRSGPFAFSRNPIYIGMIVFLTGLGLLLGSLSPFAICIAFPLLLHYRFVRTEERMLAERFGTEWQDYSARVRRWL
jgi:protein-S-isoprenylcysteine O-methyltransferase Ste14